MKNQTTPTEENSVTIKTKALTMLGMVVAIMSQDIRLTRLEGEAPSAFDWTWLIILSVATLSLLVVKAAQVVEFIKAYIRTGKGKIKFK